MKRLSTFAASLALIGGLTATPALVAPALAEPTPLSNVSELNVTPEVKNTDWYKEYGNDDRVLKLQATSPAMNNRAVPLAVIPAKDANRPTLYLLNGAGSAEQNADWLSNSDAVEFYADKNVNVVIPQAGAFSYYTDWLEEPQGAYLRGPQKWETFLTKELPEPIESRLNANDKRAIAGMSMSATSSLLLAQHNPGFYQAAGSFAGCAATASPLENQYVRVVLNRGGATPEQMWGPQGSPTNWYNDALANAEKLRGTDLYISSATGLAGAQDLPSYYTNQGMNEIAAQLGTARLRLEGGLIEGAVNACTHQLKAKLDSVNVPATYNFRNAGTHSWPGWREDIRESWPVFERALNS